MALQKLSSLKESKKLTQSEMQQVVGGGTFSVCTNERYVWDDKYMQMRLHTTTYRYDDSGNMLSASTAVSAPSNLC